MVSFAFSFHHNMTLYRFFFPFRSQQNATKGLEQRCFSASIRPVQHMQSSFMWLKGPLFIGAIVFYIYFFNLHTHSPVINGSLPVVPFYRQTVPCRPSPTGYICPSVSTLVVLSQSSVTNPRQYPWHPRLSHNR